MPARDHARRILAFAVPLLIAQPCLAQNTLLRFCPPSDPTRYHDRYEFWVAIGSRDPGTTALYLDVWRTERATCGADSTVVISTVDSALANSPLHDVPPDLAPTARMLRGTRETIVLSPQGRELRYDVRGITVGEVVATLTGSPNREQIFRQWRMFPLDSVASGATWTDSVMVTTGTIVWNGPVAYRLRGLDQAGGRTDAHITASGTLRTHAPFIDPLVVQCDVHLDAASGAVRTAQIRQEGGITGRTTNLHLRDTWKIERIP